MSFPEEVKYHLDPSAVRIFQELADQHPTKIDNDGTLTHEEALDLFDQDQDGRISGKELFSALAPLTGLLIKNFETVERYLRPLTLIVSEDDVFAEARREAGGNAWMVGARYFATPAVTRNPLPIPSKPSDEEIARLISAVDLAETEQRLNDLLVNHGLPSPADRSQLSEEESNQRVDWVLSWLSIEGYQQDLFMALMTQFPQMSEDRKNLLFDYALPFSHPANAVVLLDSPLSRNQQEMIFHHIMIRGSETDILQLERRDPELMHRLRSQHHYVEKAGYVQDLGREHFVDHLPDEADEVSIHVHPFFSIIETYKPRSRSELLQVIEKLAAEGDFFKALDLYQELQRIDSLVKEGKPILFVLGYYDSGELNRDRYMKRYTHLLKDVLGGYQNFYFVESAQFGSGDLVGYNRPILATKLDGKRLTFSGGFVDRCLERAVVSLAGWGLTGGYHVAGSSVQEGDLQVPITAAPLPRFDRGVASLDHFFRQHANLISQYDRVVDEMLRAP
ncbi:MAG: hypothetical protein HYT76_06400 [Deltaproteobacteria bacterium]|nr:hypothetical protein [Deltaproteobacteria bacterium]